MLSCVFSLQAQQEIEVSGKVTDETGEGLIGVNIYVKERKGLGVITDIDGNYTIRVREYQTLVYSYIGYVSKEATVKSDSHVINVQLDESKLKSMR